MKTKWLKSPILLFLAIIIFFFFKFFLFGQIPLASDLLISESNPWKEYSYLGYIPGTYPSKLQYGDVIHQIYPWKTFTIISLKNGQLPLWNPYSFSGHPFLADIQSAVFQPLNLLFLVLSQPNAWALSIIFQPLLALIGTYFFTRKIGLSKESSVFSAISYGLCLFMSTFLEYNTIGHILAYLPFSLLSIELLLENVGILRIILFVGVVVLTIFAGHIQLAGFNLIFIFVYLLARLKNVQKKFRKSLLFLILLLSSLGISAIQILPTLELIRLSARVSQNYQFLIEKLLIQPFQTVLFFSPNFFGNPVTRNYKVLDSYPGNSLYIGIIPIIFAISAIFYFRKNWFITFFTTSSFALILLFFRTPLSEFFYRLNVPFFSTGSPTNAIYLLSFSLAVLAGFGMDYFKKFNKNKTILLSIFILVFISINVLLLKNIADVKNIILSYILIFVFIAINIFRKFPIIKNGLIIKLFILITIFDLFFFFQKFNPFLPKEIIFPSNTVLSVIKKEVGISRFWGYGFANVEPNFNTQFGIFSPEGTDPLYPKIYGELIQSAEKGKLGQGFTNQTRSDAIIVQESGDNFIKNTSRLKLLEMLGTEYILDKKNRDTSNISFPIDQFTIFYQDNIWRLFKDKNAANRAFFVNNINFYKDNQQFEKIFFSNSFNVKTDILVENNAFSNKQISNIGKKADLKLKSYLPSVVIFSSKSDTNQILFLSDTYYPGWKATVDGTDTKIVKANYAFRAIAVPKGFHIIKFSYFPMSFLTGLLLSLFSLAGLILLCILNSRKKYFE